MEPNRDTDARDLAALGWSGVMHLIGFCFGAWAVRGYWGSIPHSDIGMSGLFYFALAFVLFFVASGIAVALLLLVTKPMGNAGRLGIIGCALLVLWIGFIKPLRQTPEISDTKPDADKIADFQANLIRLQKEMAVIPHAPPGVVPEMLGYQRDGNTIHITNRGQTRLTVSLALVLRRGPQWERCWGGVEAKNCSAEARSCQYRQTRDGGKVIDTVMVWNNRPRLEPGQSKAFLVNCGIRFADAPVEFLVLNEEEKRYTFKSDSAFVPDFPELWK